MSDNTPMITAEASRLAGVLDHARLDLPTGMFRDAEAIERAEELGLVERSYRYPLGILGLSYLQLTEAGRARIGEPSP